MNAWKVILATLVIFGTGVVTGGLLVSYAVHANQPITAPTVQAGNQTAPNPWQLRTQLIRRLVHELNLTSAQRERIEQIIKDSQDRTKEILKPVQGPMNKEVKRMFHDVREQLTTDQQVRLDELLRTRQVPERRRMQTNSPRGPIESQPANP